MRNTLKISCLLISLMAFQFLGAQKSKGKKGDCPTYTEDIQKTLPVFEKPNSEVAEPDTEKKAELKDDSKGVDSVSLGLKEYYKNKVYARGWRIQIWDGQNHIEMNQSIDKYKLYFEDLNLLVHDNYDKTMFRVRIGDFTDRLDAFRSLQEIKEQFPNALLVPDSIELNKI